MLEVSKNYGKLVEDVKKQREVRGKLGQILGSKWEVRDNNGKCVGNVIEQWEASGKVKSGKQEGSMRKLWEIGGK